MRILIVSQYFWPENFRINEISKYLSNKGYKIDVYTSYPNYPFKHVYKNLKYDDKKFYKNINIIRIPSFSRGKGDTFDLFLNYFTFIISGVFFSHFKLRGKKYDYILTFATSPVTVSLLSIYINFFKKTKLVLWLLDYWPDIIFELNYVKSKFNKIILSNIVNYIYKKQHCILAQSETYLKRIKKTYKKNYEKKFIYFPSWPEEIKKTKNKNVDKLFKDYSNELKIVFTGNIGQAQGFEKVVSFCEKFKRINFNIFVIGTGRWLDKIKETVKNKKIKNISFFGHKPVNKIHPFLKNADILLVTLKEGKVFDATIPGKFSTYLKYNKPILGLIGGETKNLINNNSLGFALNNFRSKNNNLKLFKFLKKKKLNKINNTSYIENNFSKEKILNKLDYYFHENKIKLRFITKSNQIKFKNNFVLSAFNLAFIGSWVSKDIKIYNELYCWPDGLFKNTLLKNIPKLPGRDLIKSLKIPKNIDKIRIVGNSSERVEKFLFKKFKYKKFVNNKLPYGNIEEIKKTCNFKLSKNELTLITLPTPKQEIIAEHLKNNNKNYRIVCIGGGLKMASGEERPPPKSFENYGLETIWRLRNETSRRISRLLISFYYFLRGYINNSFKDIILEKNEKS